MDHHILAMIGGAADPDSGVRIDVRDLDHLGIVSAIWDELDITASINHAVGADPQVAVAPGLVFKTLALDVLHGRAPLYMLEERWDTQLPLPQLVGGGVQPGDLNDTSLGRHMDRMFAAGCSKVFDAVVLRALVVERLATGRPLHVDTTSRVLFGEYPDPARPDVVSVTRGHSKDHRPDLAQVMFGLVTDEDGVPVSGRVLDGNTEDKAWFGHLLGHLRTWQRGLPAGPVELVGDAALINTPNLAVAAEQGIVLTGRLPRTVTACQDAVAQALAAPQAWEDIGAAAEGPGGTRYQAQRQEREVLGQAVQLGIYRAETSQARAQNSVDRRAGRALKEAQREAKALAAVEHHCAADAQAALDQACARLGGDLLQVRGEVQAERKPLRSGRGRPRQDLSGPVQEVHTVHLTAEVNAGAVTDQARDESCFVILHSGKEPLSAAEILQRYKRQATIEKRFPFLKDPAWVNAFFVKKPEHVEVLGYVLLLALLVWAVWERRVRKNLAASKGKPLREPSGVKHARPTAQACTHVMAGVRLVRAVQDGHATPWRLAGALTPEQARLMSLSGRCAAVATRDAARTEDGVG